MTDDIIYRSHKSSGIFMSKEHATDAALHHMAHMLAFHGRTLDQFKGMPQPSVLESDPDRQVSCISETGPSNW